MMERGERRNHVRMHHLLSSSTLLQRKIVNFKREFLGEERKEMENREETFEEKKRFINFSHIL